MKNYFTLLFLSLSTLVFTQDINFPDSLFKKALVSSICVDTNGDGFADADADTNNDLQISISEALNVQHLNVNTKQIKSVEGISNFKNLVSFNCLNNPIENLSIENFESLQSLNVVNSSLVNVKIVGNKKLKTLFFKTGFFNDSGFLKIKYLDCSNNALETILIGGQGYINVMDLSNNNLSNYDHDYDIGFDSVLLQNNKLKNNVNAFINYGAKYLDIRNNETTILESANFYSNGFKDILFDKNPLTQISIPIFKSNIDISNFPTLKLIIINKSNFSYPNEIVNISLDNLISLERVSIDIESVSNLNIKNIASISGSIVAPNSNIFFEKVKNIDNLNISYVNIVQIKNCNEMVSLKEKYNCKKLYIKDCENLKFLNINFNSSSFNTKTIFTDSLHIANLPILDTLIINGEGKAAWEEPTVSINVSDFPSLRYLKMDKNLGAISFSLNKLPKLNRLDINSFFPNLNLTSLPSLKNVIIKNAKCSSFNLRDLPELENVHLDCEALKVAFIKKLPLLKTFIYEAFPIISNDKSIPIDSFVFEDLPSLHTIEFRRPKVKYLEMKNLPNLTSFQSIVSASGPSYIPINMDYNFKNLPSINNIKISEMSVRSLNIENSPNLKTLHYLRNKGMSILDFPSIPLDSFYFHSIFSQINVLDLTKLSEIKYIECEILYGINLKLGKLPKLEELKIIGCIGSSGANPFPLDIVGFQNLKKLTMHGCYNKIKITDNPQLRFLDLSRNHFDQFDLVDLPQLEEFLISYFYRDIKNFKTSKLPKLKKIEIKNIGQIDTLDLSDTKSLEHLTVNANREIQFINLRNDNPILKSFVSSKVTTICVDNESEIDLLKTLNTLIATKTNFNTYCSFKPSGKHYVVMGRNYFDANNNGCDANDQIFPNLKLKVEGNNPSTIICNHTGNYFIPVLAGNSTIKPIVENPDYYNISSSLSVVFPKTGGDTIFHNFCVSPRNKLSRINISILPLTPPARPGFYADYKIVWENSGNQIENGTLNFTYNEKVLDFYKASLQQTQKADGIINWNFNNFLPFEKREIIVTMKVNKPTDTPPVNAGDNLYFSAAINDNVFKLENKVVGSYDPNDKTCLQGQLVHPNLIGKHVDYFIRFENKGNYAAENVVIKDVIDIKKFDVSTLTITDSSHPMFTRIEGNKVEFIFENIQLPFNDATNDGYVAFKIKTQPTLLVGDSLKNLADIFFDYNFPIRTNETKSAFALPTSSNDVKMDVQIFPNPVEDVLYLQTEEIWTKANIFDMEGRIFRSHSLDMQVINTGDLKSGIYILQLKNSTKSVWSKFVKL